MNFFFNYKKYAKIHLVMLMKILVNPIDIEHIKYLNKKDIGGYIIGLKNYSIFQNLKLSIEEIKNIDTDKEIYISINKPIHNNEIDDIKNILKELSKMKINGILYEDIAIYNINKNMNLNLNLILATMHIPTNSVTCNYWKDKGVKGALLSTELMYTDFIKIKKDTNMIIMVYLYGYVPIFESKRELITSYMKHINKDKTDNIYYMYEKERCKYYPIYEEENNTFITEDILNGISVLNELEKNNIDYIILNSLMHNKENFNKIVDEYINRKILKKDVFTGFLYKESIFKVKQ